MNFGVDLKGRVRNINLPKSKALLPVFEAVINSIQAIEDRQNSTGSINIRVIRKNEQKELISESGFAPIESFEIEDNGIGFNKDNYHSFLTSDSTLKISRGSKGLGRFTWLKAFSQIKVSSIYLEEGGYFKKDFVFDTNNGISQFCSSELDKQPQDRATVIKLLGYKSPYYSSCPQKVETIAKRILEHCIVYFLLDIAPQIKVIDGKDSVNLNYFFRDNMEVVEQTNKFKIGEYEFYLNSVKFYGAKSSDHKIIYCANQRGVSEEKLSSLIPNLYENKKIKDEDGNSFTYLTCLSGKYLDERVNSERTGFNIETKSSALLSLDPNYIDFTRLKDSFLPLVSRELHHFLDSVEEEKQDYIREYVFQEAPEYRPLIKYAPDRLKEIKPNLKKSKLDLELHKLMHEYEIGLKETREEILKTPREYFHKYPEYLEKYYHFLEQSNDIGMSRLAKYVTHRKTIIELFENNLYRDQDGKYSLEKNVHELVFPMSTTSDETNIFQKQNLWMIDERLSFHEYLASDISFTSQENSNLSDLERPDIVIFNSPIAFADSDSFPYSSVVIVEFKRPERDDYSDNENPILQVLNYIDKISSGSYKDKRGRTINLPKSTPFYAYILCDITPKLQKITKPFNYTQTADSQGYFGYHQDYNAYVEIMSFTKLVDDAKKRNHVLFKNLGL